ncbi:MAG: hypothetical protein Kilf2KO_25860 [Rhodospirillales bacterium]
MDTITMTEDGDGKTRRLRRPGTWLQVLSDLVFTWQERDAERVHLSRLDNRMLANMGLTKADVCHEADKPFWRG